MYCVTIYNENLRKLNGDESLRITRLVQIPSCLYTGQAAQLIATQGQSRSGDREVPGSVHMHGPMADTCLVVIS